ncbi:hypothetical protein J5X84_27915 [Streptosporangiaceae bacterium NEAU-GS5]|nr:hypothetical protein [Streptosporangiaceae bacterium NEAU-GS5]
MTHAFTYEVPIGPDVYARIKEGLGPEPPKGLIAHLAYRTDNGLRYVDVWQSQSDWETFVEERLHPVVDGILTETLGFRPPEPSMERLDIIDAWIGT